jgi:putative flippase GtrA
LGSGVANTVAGFAVIFTLTASGIAPVTANACGYAVGLMLGFVLSRNFVFRSNGHLVTDSVRYLAAFLVSFLINLAVLKFALNGLHLNELFAQVLATVAYTISMYGLARHIVFNGSGEL